MKAWRVHAWVSELVTLHVAAATREQAVGVARERLAADRCASKYTTASQPTEVGDFERDWYDARDDQNVLRGRLLTADMLAYCLGRGYTHGFDVDAFPGVQLSHLCDDSVAFCRTSALWMVGDPLQGGSRVSCPFCWSILHKEMQYPELRLHVERRHDGQHAVAEWLGGLDGSRLLVNGVVVRELRRKTRDYDPEYEQQDDELRELERQINAAQACRPLIERIGPPRARTEPEARMMHFVRTALALKLGEELTGARRAELTRALDELRAEMTDVERAAVDEYLSDDD